MHTKDKLAQALTEAGFTNMAAKAAEGYYHDYLSPLPMPSLQLVHDLGLIGTDAAKALSARVICGDFDASEEEADAWALSEDGREAFARLLGQKPPATD